MSYTDDIYTLANICRTDPAFIAGMSDALRKSGLGEMCGWTPPPVAVEGPPPAFPASYRITIIQTSIFDNWPAGKPVKGMPSRYGMALEVWTKEANKVVIQKGRKPNFDFKSQSALMDGQNLKRQVADIRRKQRRVPVNPDYLDYLEALAEAIAGTNLRVAMVNTNVADDKSGYDRGRYYHSHQLVILEMDGPVVVGGKLMLAETDTITLAPFADTDAAGNALGAKVVAQSRDDRCDLNYGRWATNES